MITSPFILNLSFANLCTVLLNKSLPTTIYLLTYLNSITIYVSSQGQTDLIYFDLGQDFDKVPHSLLQHKPSNFGLPDY
jgi:hypothetical protein